MADNNHKVTIDAAWFAELYRKATEPKTQMVECKGECQSLKALAKERDELKAKLDCAEVDRETYKDRAEAAERCIEEIEAVMSDGVIADCAEGMKVNGIIRAYREKKEAER